MTAVHSFLHCSLYTTGCRTLKKQTPAVTYRQYMRILLNLAF